MNTYTNYKFVTVNSKEELDGIEAALEDDINMSVGEIFGFIVDIDAKECVGKNNNKFTLIEFSIKGQDNKRYRKTFSVDFMRAYLKQLDCEIQELTNVVVLVKPTGEYNNIGKFAPVASMNWNSDDAYFAALKYINEPVVKDWDVFKKLGL